MLAVKKINNNGGSFGVVFVTDIFHLVVTTFFKRALGNGVSKTTSVDWPITKWWR